MLTLAEYKFSAILFLLLSLIYLSTLVFSIKSKRRKREKFSIIFFIRPHFHSDENNLLSQFESAMSFPNFFRLPFAYFLI